MLNMKFEKSNMSYLNQSLVKEIILYDEKEKL